MARIDQNMAKIVQTWISEWQFNGILENWLKIGRKLAKIEFLSGNSIGF